MATLVVMIDCRSEVRIGITTVTVTPNHERCPGRSTIPGLLGGTICSCECHQKRERFGSR